MITRELLRDLRVQIDEALKEIGEKNKIQIKAGNARFTANTASFKLDIGSISEDGEIFTKEAEDFKDCCHRWGFKSSDLGRTFKSRGNEFKIVGAKPRSKKYPILAQKLDTEAIYKFPPTMIKLV